MRYIRSASMGLVMLWVQACGGEPYVDAKCSETIDCAANPNFTGVGSECLQGHCRCPGLFDVPCCPDGSQDTCGNQEYVCKNFTDCVPKITLPGAGGSGGAGGAGTSVGGAGGEGALPGGECAAPIDCHPPVDPLCGSVTCEEGSCNIDIKVGPIYSQLKGDCEQVECDFFGHVVTIEDASDWYNDGKECTLDYCVNGEKKSVPVWDGYQCPETGAGVCFEGSCVECLFDIGEVCGNGYTCDGYYCVPVACVMNKNGMADGLETGVDCGGSCYPCFNPQTCKSGADCAEGVCNGGTCALPTHSDGVQNDNETGVDCGCLSCDRCADGSGCATGDDCKSLSCWGGKCQAPTCSDGLQNGGEAGIDCGAVCNNSCP